ncbi:MAG: hypothetical protein OXG53_00125 [Chloroflexi bacterium]|nr:hypothetical protein [Chloroflexota bacterium]
MTSARKTVEQIREARSTLDILFKQPGTVTVIHYSCEDFRMRNDGTTPRITSIAICNLENGQSKSFSIHHAAEIKRLPICEIPNKYDELELTMLDNFFRYVGQLQNSKWIHWNMRDSNFGFEAIEHRFRVLGGSPAVIPEAQRFDLPRLLSKIYGEKYIGDPKLKSLVTRNNLTNLDFIPGEDEPAMFAGGKYVQMHQSTLRKTVVIAEIARRAWRQELKTDNKWWSAYGISVKAWIETIYEHWVFKAVGIIIALFALYQIGRAIGVI